MTRVELPALIAEIETLIGLDGALRFASAFGGRAFYVPLHPGEGHRLSQTVGFEAARKLSARYGAEILHVPRASAAWRAQRNRQIRSRWKAGEGAGRLARAFGLSERHIFRILIEDPPRRRGKRAAELPRQRGLFDPP